VTARGPGDAASRRALRAVRLAHTGVWAFFAGSIVAIPAAAWTRRFDLWLALVGIVMVEVLVLAVNGMKCPLTAVAARYTDDRRDNFDIYLPLFVARYNKQIFGGLYVAGIAYGLARFLG
jgi:hypothetical protein